MHPIIAYRGVRFTIEYAIRRGGTVPALDFFNAIDTRWQARLLILFKLLGDTGLIRNPEHFGKFTDGFFEFKAFQVRMPCYFRPDKRVVITHGFIKKREGTAPRSESERARSIRAEYEDRITSKEGSRK